MTIDLLEHKQEYIKKCIANDVQVDWKLVDVLNHVNTLMKWDYSKGFIETTLKHGLSLTEASQLLYDVVSGWRHQECRMSWLLYQDGCEDADYFVTCL